jgi:hypothetical protein
MENGRRAGEDRDEIRRAAAGGGARGDQKSSAGQQEGSGGKQRESRIEGGMKESRTEGK